jgi:GAF domain-containing protein
MAQLNEMAGELNLALNDVDVLTIAGINTCKLMGVEQVSVSLLDSTGEMIDSRFINDKGLTDQKVTLPIAGTGVERIIQENRVVAWPDEAGIGDEELQQMSHLGVKAIIGAPLQVLGEMIGVISAPRFDRSLFTAEEKSLMSQISALTSSALQIHRLVDQATAQANREHVLHEISTRVRTAVDADTILRTAVRELGDALGRKTFIQLGGEVNRNGR